MNDQPTTPTYKWVRLSLHCAVTGDTPDAVHAGLTAVLEGLRKACPRVMSTRRL